MARSDISGYCTKLKREPVGGKNNDLETNSSHKNIEDLHRPASEFKKGYEARTNLVKVENGNLFGDLLSILNKRRNYFSHLLNKVG